MRVTTSRIPVFSALTDGQCRTVLRRNDAGRVSFPYHRNGETVAVVYATDGCWIYLRPTRDTRIDAFSEYAYVVLEVTEGTPGTEWRSVVAHGTIHAISDDGPEARRRAYAQGFRLLHGVSPGELSRADQPLRGGVVYGIYVDTRAGRVSWSGDGVGRPMLEEERGC